MTSLVNKSADLPPNYHKIIFFPTKSLKSLHTARIDELADSNEPAKMLVMPTSGFPKKTRMQNLKPKLVKDVRSV